MNDNIKEIEHSYQKFINEQTFPCIGAKAAIAKGGVNCIVAGNMACPADDMKILEYLYSFADGYENDRTKLQSAAVIFQAPVTLTEKEFEKIMWMRLQSLSDMDAKKYRYDKRVSADPASPDFSFSLKEEAYYIVGLHSNSCRKARRFAYPTLVFNSHAQFEMLKKTTKYQSMQRVIRKRDLNFSGTVNPMLEDHGQSSEAKQYSGINYGDNFECPLKITHAT